MKIIDNLSLILDFSFLKNSNLLLIEFLNLLKIKYQDIDYEINQEILKSLQEKNFIKIIKNENIVVIREKGNLLLDYLIIKNINDIKENKKIIKKSEREINNGLNEFIIEYRNLWKGLKIGSMGSHNTCYDKLSRWLIANPNHTKEEVLKAAKLYINSLNDYQYLQQADYFIYKKDGIEESSRLSAFVEEDEIDNSDWTTKLS